MRRDGIAFSQFFFKPVKRLLRFALARDDSECPISNFLAAGKPFVGPGKKNRSSKTAFYHAIDMPGEHVGLLVLRMSDRVHAEFAKDQRTLACKILQPQQIPLELVLIVEVNIETAKIGILRQQIFGRRIGGVGKEGVRINRASDSD